MKGGQKLYTKREASKMEEMEDGARYVVSVIIEGALELVEERDYFEDAIELADNLADFYNGIKNTEISVFDAFALRNVYNIRDEEEVE
jgi:hypothetical protein